MKYLGIRKKDQGKFITRYDVDYEAADGRKKVYEMISRNPDIQTFENLHGKGRPDAVVMILHDSTGEKILISREFRMAAGMWVMNFPAGLIEEGETPDEAAARELREETGLHLISIEDHFPESYSAIGFSNEKNVCVIGTAEGEIRQSDSVFEEIQAGWYTRAEVRNLLKTEMFTARSQAYCYLWSK